MRRGEEIIDAAANIRSAIVNVESTLSHRAAPGRMYVTEVVVKTEQTLVVKNEMILTQPSFKNTLTVKHPMFSRVSGYFTLHSSLFSLHSNLIFSFYSFFTVISWHSLHCYVFTYTYSVYFFTLLQPSFFMLHLHISLSFVFCYFTITDLLLFMFECAWARAYVRPCMHVCMPVHVRLWVRACMYV